MVESAIAKALTVELAPVKSTVERPHLVKSTAAKSTAVKAAKPAAKKAPAATAAVRPGIGEIWLTKRGGA